MRLLKSSLTSRAFLPGLLLTVSSCCAHAQTSNIPARITQAIDEKNLVTLSGNVHPLARPEFDQGPVADAQSLKRMLLLLQRGPEQKTALQQLLEEQQDKSSANYHAWLTPDQFGKQFGLADADVQAVTQWLAAHGFTEIKIGAGRNVIEFSGNVANVRNAFHTEIHRYLVNGEEHMANASDPQIPVALTPAVAGVVSLHNFPRKTMHRLAGVFTRSKDTGQVKLVKPAGPELTFQCGINPNTGQPFYCNALVPYDFATIYNVLPLWNGTPAIDGAGQTIAIVGESNINVQDVRDFRTSFGLPANDPVVVLNGPDPGLVPGVETEADLDVEWSGGVAKGATIKLVVSQSTETSAGVDLSAEYVIDNNLAPILSESFGDCELNFGTVGNQFYNHLWQQAAAQGITVFVASGDNGAAGCDFNQGSVPQPANNGLQVSGIASTPYNVAVGGTDFNDFFTESTYWNTTTNDPTTQRSAKSYIPETTWNDSCTNAIFGDPRIGFSTNAETNCNDSRLTGFVFTIGGSGGKSNCTTPSGQTPTSCAGGYAKPSWQIGAGVPLDGKRDLPDVSLFSSDGFVGNSYAMCEADITGFCNSTNFLGVGGTSASAPAFAGIMALVNQKTQSRQGNANVVLYKLATKQSASSCNSSTGPASTCVFNDVTSGTIAMPCTKASPDCTTSNSNDRYGILSGYNAGAGYDLATGLGSVNAQNLVNNWSSVTFLASTTTLSASVKGATVTSITGIAHGTPVGVNSNVTAGSGATGTPTGQVALIATPNPTPGNPSASLGIEALTLSSGAASSTSVILPGGSYNLTAHYQGDGTFGGSDSGPISVSITSENSKTLISFPMFSSSTGQETGNTPTSLVYGSLYFGRIDVGNAQAALSFPPNPICTPPSCPTGTVTWTDSLNGGTPTPLDGGTFSLNSEGYTEDQVIQPTLLGGSHVLTASYNGDNSYGPSSSTYPLTVKPAPTSFSAQILGGSLVSGVTFQVLVQGNAQTQFGIAPTGTMTFMDGNTQLGSPVTINGSAGQNGSAPSFFFITSLTIATGGSHTLTANYSGDTNYAPSSFSLGSVLVLWQTAATVNVSTTNINYGQSITVTGSVTTSGKSPAMTGTLNFFGSFTAIPGPVTPKLSTDASGNQTLSATITTTPQDSENVQLTYSGDANFAGSSAISSFITVNIPDFTLPPNTTITVTAGQSQTVTVNVTPLSTTPSTVALSSSGTPSGMTLSFNPSTVNLNGAAAPVMITLTTTGPNGGPAAAMAVMGVKNGIVLFGRWTWWSTSLASGLVMLFLLGMPGRRKRYGAALLAGALFVLTLALGCGGGNGGGGGGGPFPTSIKLTTSNAKVAAGGSFTLTAKVTSSGTLTGTVNIFAGHPPNGLGVAPPIQVVNGTASAIVTIPPTFSGPGTYEFWAQYMGDPNNLPSQTTTSVEEVLTGTAFVNYMGQTGGLTHQATITINLQ